MMIALRENNFFSVSAFLMKSAVVIGAYLLLVEVKLWLLVLILLDLLLTHRSTIAKMRDVWRILRFNLKKIM